MVSFTNLSDSVTRGVLVAALWCTGKAMSVSVCITSLKRCRQKRKWWEPADSQGTALLLPWIHLASSEIHKGMQSCNTLLETSGAFGVQYSSNEMC